MTNREIAEQLKTLSMKELREALEFHFAHMKLIHAEVDERITKVNEQVEKAQNFLKATE